MGKSGIRTAIFIELWLKMHGIQFELGVKNMSDLVRKEFRELLTPKISQKNGYGIIKHGLMMVFTLLKNFF